MSLSAGHLARPVLRAVCKANLVKCVLRALLDSDIPGFGELFRMLSHSEIGSAAILSRALGGVLEGRVVLALPGSVKALCLAMEQIVLPEAGHLVAQARNR